MTVSNAAVRLTLATFLGVVLFGCPPAPPDWSDDDDDDQVGDDDDVEGDDDTGDLDDDDDDAVGDDDDDAIGDDDDIVGDDDDVVGDDDDASGECPGCVYEFAVTFTTAAQKGQCLWCWDLEDGTYDMGYGGGTIYLHYDGGYGAAWYWWYYGSQNGNTVDFWYEGYYYDYAFAQEGYWNITGGGSAMTGRAMVEETTAGEMSYRCVQQLTGTGN